MMVPFGFIRDDSQLFRDYPGLFVIIQDCFVSIWDYLGIMRNYSDLVGGGPDEFNPP